jgi:D-glycero-D-manno-heptose 1,7-bisphosphate phosphatase
MKGVATRPAVFVDRDGTLMEEVHYCNDPANVRIIPGAGAALRELRSAGYVTVLVTNQSGIGRGIITRAQYESVHLRLIELLGENTIDRAYMCADPNGQPSTHRKPSPGMLLEAAADLSLDLGSSWIIGDKALDIECGINAGVAGVLVKTGYGHSVGECGAKFVAQDIVDAAHWILQNPCCSLDSVSKTGLRQR